jgi:hypothetical protein
MPVAWIQTLNYISQKFVLECLEKHCILNEQLAQVPVSTPRFVGGGGGVEETAFAVRQQKTTATTTQRSGRKCRCG